MTLRRQVLTAAHRRGCGLLLLLLAMGPSPRSFGLQQAPTSAPATIRERQSGVRDRVQRLEVRMIELARRLAEKEPGKAERLRDTLSLLGKQRIKSRLATLMELLEKDDYAAADPSQADLLRDFEALLTLLTDATSDIDRQREERRRLEALKRSIRSLLDEQLQHLYGVQHAEQQLQSQAEPGAAITRELQETLNRLEDLQRQTQQKTTQLQSEMESQREAEKPTPGVEELQQAAEEMRQAGDQLGESQPSGARSHQQNAVEQMQKALDQLDEALRQSRREETEETLAAMETRLQSIVAQEREVLSAAEALGAKPSATWSAADRMRLSEASERHQTASEEARVTLRLMVDEGTTLVAPELLSQVVGEMGSVAQRLPREDVGAETLNRLTEIVASLQEILDVITAKREQDAKQDGPQGPQQAGQQTPPLLPRSAELKLLRSSQLRLNRRFEALQSLAAPAEELLEEGRVLGERQARLSELTRRMHERQ